MGLGGVIAAYRGLRWVGVELEERFQRMGNGYDCPGIDHKQWVRWFGRFSRCPYLCPICQSSLGVAGSTRGLLPTDGDGMYYRDGKIPWRAPHRYMGNFEHAGVQGAVLLQGDSRQFAAIVGGCAGIVTSPPYAEGLGHCRAEHASNDAGRATVAPNAGKFSKSDLAGRDYGTTPGQIGQLKAGDLDAILTSPPYAESAVIGPVGKANIGAKGDILRKQGIEAGYGQTPGNIGNLPDKGLDGIVTSPPWEGNPASKESLDGRAGTIRANPRYPGEKLYFANYAKQDSDGNLGNDSGDTYWGAVKTVYEQCLLALKPGGVLACVVKMYAKQGALVPLPDQTHDLLLHIGFEPLERVHALLVKETTVQGLFGPETKRTARKSFFRRLAEQAKAAAECWEGLAAYEQLSALAAVREELGVDADEKAVLRAAQKAALLAWEAEHGHWASEIDIDWEDVLFVRKPQ